MHHKFTALITAILLLASRPGAAPQEPTLAAVLERAASYVADFHRRLTSIVAEERYIQDWKLVTRAELRGTRDIGHRELGSDLLLVKPHGDAPWMEFRDVFEVDGAAIRDRNERLVKMFLEPSESGRAGCRDPARDAIVDATASAGMFRLSTDVRVIAFDEIRSNTMIRTGSSPPPAGSS